MRNCTKQRATTIFSAQRRYGGQYINISRLQRSTLNRSQPGQTACRPHFPFETTFEEVCKNLCSTRAIANSSGLGMPIFVCSPASSESQLDFVDQALAEYIQTQTCRHFGLTCGSTHPPLNRRPLHGFEQRNPSLAARHLTSHQSSTCQTRIGLDNDAELPVGTGQIF
jgi:hypothetical protein